MFSDNLKQMRKHRNLNQKDIAKSLHIGQSTVSAWESGKTEPNIEMLIKLANVMGVSIDAILGNEQTLDPQEDRLIITYRMLNESGKAALLEQAEFFASSEKYTKHDQKNRGKISG